MNAEGDGPDLGALIRAHATRHRASAALREAILRDVAAEAGTPAHVQPARSPSSPPRRWTWAGLGAVVGSLATAAVVWTVVLPLQREAGLQDELVGHHVRALMPGHLADVDSTDRHTVKPWFQGKLDYAPPVEDPAPDTPLVGGRLDVVNGRPVAVLVYRQRAHVIDAFVWPSSEPSALRTHQLRGFSVVSWSDGAMQHWLVSDLNGPALVAFAEQLRDVPR